MSDSFVSDGGIEIDNLVQELFGQKAPATPEIVGPFCPVDTCFTDLEVLEQKTALAAIASQVKVYEQVQNHVDALNTLADGIEDAVAEIRDADVRLATGAFPDDLVATQQSLSSATFELIDAIRAYANVIASKYGVNVA